MVFENKDLLIDKKRFLVKYLTHIEEYQLEISSGRIVIGVFYIPSSPVSMVEAELTLEKYLSELRREINTVIMDNREFYKIFKQDNWFTVFGSSGGKNIYGETVAEYSKALISLTKMVE